MPFLFCSFRKEFCLSSNQNVFLDSIYTLLHSNSLFVINVMLTLMFLCFVIKEIVLLDIGFIYIFLKEL